MKVTSLRATQFRNLAEVAVEPCDGMNVLYGDNAHGKTNLLETIWLMTGGKSFRGSKDSDMIAFGKDKASVSMIFEGGGRTQTIDMTIEKRRKAMLNKLPLTTVRKLTGIFCAVIFSPDHLSLVKDGPEERRRFLDAACCQLRPTYMKVIADYTRVLTQRNTLIKAVKSGEQRLDTMLLDTFDERLAQSGAAVRRFRKDYVDALSPFAAEVYHGLSKGREQLAVLYENSQQDAAMLYEDFRRERQTDLRAGFTTIGPHRDDLTVMIGDTLARSFGSQGQQRSAVLSLKLAEASLLAKSYGDKPVILLDDVMSELDANRQDYILNHIDGFQVFMTCCEPSAIKGLVGGRVFHIENGRVEQRSCL